MAVAFLNSYPADYSGFSVDFGVANVQANTGELIVHTVQHSDAGGVAISAAPTWNGQTMTSAAPRANAFMWTQTWYVFASSTATANILCPTDGGASFPGVACARTYSGASAVSIVQQLAPGVWANPSLTSDSLVAGDLIDEVLNASGFDAGFGNVTGTTWAESSGQTRRETIATAATGIGTLVLSTKTGTGALVCGYTASADEPNYVHSLIKISGGVVTSIDTLTTDGSPGLVVGQPFAMTTTGLGTITSITITTDATPTATTTATSLSLPAGDGTAAARSWVDGAFYAFPGTVTVVAGDGTLTATGSYTLSMPDDYLDVVFADVETTDDTYIGTKLDDLGHPLEDGDIGYYPVGNGLAIGTNGHISCDGAMTFVLWIQKLTGVMEMYNVTINDAGEITGATGITSRGITSQGITTRNITTRGIT